MSDEEDVSSPVPAARRCAMLLFSPKKAFSRFRKEPLKKAVIWYSALLLINLVFIGIAVTQYFRM